jgi:hypothetical protein
VICARLASAVWELPQNLLGAIVFAAAWVRGGIRHIDVEAGRLVIEAPPLGISLGSFVFYNHEGSRYFPPDPLMRQHELGHTYQSRWLGPFYLLAVGAPSTARVLYGIAFREITGRRWPGYFAGFPENWADRLGDIAREERLAWLRENYEELRDNHEELGDDHEELRDDHEDTT